MIRRRTTVSAALVVGMVLAGCGSTAQKTPTRTAISTTTTQTLASGAAVLRHAVVAAVDADHKTSVTALWTNTVPAKPVATAGPALTTLRKSVAGRRAQGIKVRVLDDHLRLISTTLDPSYTTATAVIVDAERVQPTHKNGKPFGKAVTQIERATLELHRVGDRNQFVVWKVVTSQ